MKATGGLAVFVIVLMVLPLVSGLNSAAFAQDATVEVGIANTGEQTFHGSVTIGMTPKQVRQMMVDVLQKDSLNAKRAAEFEQEVARLSAETGVHKPAIENFQRILDEAKVPIDQLSLKLAKIAQRHLEILDRWSVLEEENDPAISQRTDAAKAAIDCVSGENFKKRNYFSFPSLQRHQA